MGTPRFPRTKFVRRLLAMERELQSWADMLRQRNIQNGIAVDAGGWDDGVTAIWVSAMDMHSLADDMARLPGAAQRRVSRETRVRR